MDSSESRGWMPVQLRSGALRALAAHLRHRRALVALSSALQEAVVESAESTQRFYGGWRAYRRTARRPDKVVRRASCATQVTNHTGRTHLRVHDTNFVGPGTPEQAGQLSSFNRWRGATSARAPHYAHGGRQWPTDSSSKPNVSEQQSLRLLRNSM